MNNPKDDFRDLELQVMEQLLLNFGFANKIIKFNSEKYSNQCVPLT